MHIHLWTNKIRQFPNCDIGAALLLRVVTQWLIEQDADAVDQLRQPLYLVSFGMLVFALVASLLIAVGVGLAYRFLASRLPGRLRTLALIVTAVIAAVPLVLFTGTHIAAGAVTAAGGGDRIMRFKRIVNA